VQSSRLQSGKQQAAMHEHAHCDPTRPPKPAAHPVSEATCDGAALVAGAVLHKVLRLTNLVGGGGYLGSRQSLYELCMALKQLQRESGRVPLLLLLLLLLLLMMIPRPTPASTHRPQPPNQYLTRPLDTGSKHIHVKHTRKTDSPLPRPASPSRSGARQT